MMRQSLLDFTKDSIRDKNKIDAYVSMPEKESESEKRLRDAPLTATQIRALELRREEFEKVDNIKYLKALERKTMMKTAMRDENMMYD